MMDWTLIRGTNSEPDPSSDVLRQDWQIKAVLASFWLQLLSSKQEFCTKMELLRGRKTGPPHPLNSLFVLPVLILYTGSPKTNPLSAV